MKTLAVYQPRVFPQLHWWNRMLQSDIFLIYDDAQFKQGSWQNRFEIIQNGKRLLRTIPINRDDKFKPINKVRVDDHRRWRRKLFRSISMNYSGEGFYDEWSGFIQEMILDSTSLFMLQTPFEIKVRNYLNIQTEVINTSELDVQGETIEKLIKFCKHYQADEYLCGKIAYDNYMNLRLFEKAEIKVRVQDWTCKYEYGNISILDSLLRYGGETKRWIS